MSNLAPFDALLPSRLVLGAGTVERIGALAALLDGRAMVVIGGSTRKPGLLNVEQFVDDAVASGSASPPAPWTWSARTW